MSNPVRRAAAELAGLYANGKTPDLHEVARAKSRLKVTRIDREIRQASADTPAPDAVDTAHLVGLLLMWGGSEDAPAARAKRAVQEVLYVTPSLTDDDRADIARAVLGSGK